MRTDDIRILLYLLLLFLTGFQPDRAVAQESNIIKQMIEDKSNADLSISQQTPQLENLYVKNDESKGPLLFYVISSALILVCSLLIIIFRYNNHIKSNEKKLGKQKRQLNAANQTIADQKLEIIALKKDLCSLQKSSYNTSGVVSKIRSINSKSDLFIDKPSLSEQEWHAYFNSLEDTFHFISRLKRSYPKLTNDEIRICALMKEGVAAAHISSIMNISLEVLSKQIQRIKGEKMGLVKHKVSLETIIRSF